MWKRDYTVLQLGSDTHTNASGSGKSRDANSRSDCLRNALRRHRLCRYVKRMSRCQQTIVAAMLLLAVLSGLHVIPSMYRDYNSLQPAENGAHRLFDITRLRTSGTTLMKIERRAYGSNSSAMKGRHMEQAAILKPPIFAEKGMQQLPPVKASGGGRSTSSERQQAVVSAFRHAWTAYKKYAWGHDELLPISKTYHEWFGVGMTLIDSLDTMYIMGLHSEFKEARDWVATKLTFDINRDVNLFECTIRVLGGLLGAYHLSNDSIFLEKATDLGDRLSGAFTAPSSVPYSDVNLHSGVGHAPRWGPDSSTAEVGSLLLEFTDLSLATHRDKYQKAVKAVAAHLHQAPKLDGLVPIFINAASGKLRQSATVSLGARGDSYYEYLLKAWLQSGRTDDSAKQDYLEAVEGMKKHLMSRSEPHKLVFFGERNSGRHFSPKMDHLVCFLAGTLALGAHNGLPSDHLELAEQLAHTCYQMYRAMPTGLSPEIVYFNMAASGSDDIIVKTADTHNLLRPETIESFFYLHRITGKPQYREWAWNIFLAFENYTKLPDGYSSINNVKDPKNVRFKDKMESFFLGETLKYFYMLFSDDQDLMPLDKWVFNTEGHALPIQTL